MKFVYHRKNKLLPNTTHDWIRTEVQLTPDRKTIVGFVVLQVYEIEDTMHEIVKHDCAHGKYHVHRYYEGPHAKVVMSEEPISDSLYQLAKRNILENGLIYRERFVRKYLTKP